MTDALPVGVHPLDRSAPFQPGFDSNLPTLADDPTPTQLADWDCRPWQVSNENARPTFQRSAVVWRPGMLVITDPIVSRAIASRQPGRAMVHLWVPASVVWQGAVVANPTGTGVVFGSDPYEPILSPTFLGVGDAIALMTEGSVYVGLAPGLSVCYVQYVIYTNPPGGQLGAW